MTRMVAISSALFAVLVWGSVALVLLVFLYVIYAVLRDAGLVSDRSPAGKTGR